LESTLASCKLVKLAYAQQNLWWHSLNLFSTYLQIFDCLGALQAKGWQHTLVASYVEIYNETIRDLLMDGGSSEAKKYEVKQGTYENTVSNAETVEVHSGEEVIALLARAQRNRSVGKTMMNEHSSRSHSVFRLTISASNSITGL
jgi:kinesin family member C1